MILKQKINTLTKSEIYRLNLSLKKACSLFFGDSGVEVRSYNKVNSINMAEYDPYLKKISIYRPMIKDVDSYVKTFIHEWIHTRQKGIKRKYLKMEKKYGYWNNPYEVEARNSEKIYKSLIWKLTKINL